MVTSISTNLKNIIDNLSRHMAQMVFGADSGHLSELFTGMVTEIISGSSGSGQDWQSSVKDRHLVAPPAGPAIKDRYIIAGIGGAWSTFTIGDIAEWDGSSWFNITPSLGFVLDVEDESEFYFYNGSSWVIAPPLFWQKVGTVLSPSVAGDDIDMGVGGLIKVDNITESTLNAGVTIETALIKDGNITCTSINPTNLPVYDVTNYGLVADAMTDNSAAFSALLTLIPNYIPCIVYFPYSASTYLFNSTVTANLTNKNIKFLGSGNNATPVSLTFAAVSGNGWVFTGGYLSFEGPFYIKNTAGLSVPGSVSLSFASVPLLFMNNVTLYECYNGIKLYNCTNVLMDNLSASNVVDAADSSGIWIYYSTTHVEINNFSFSGKGTGIRGDFVCSRININRFKYAPVASALGCGIYLSNLCYQVAINNPIFSVNAFGGATGKGIWIDSSCQNIIMESPRFNNITNEIYLNGRPFKVQLRNHYSQDKMNYSGINNPEYITILGDEYDTPAQFPFVSGITNRGADIISGVAGVKAIGKLTFTGASIAGETFVVNGTTHTFQTATPTAANQIKTGTDAATAASLVPTYFNMLSAQRANVWAFWPGTGSGDVYFYAKVPGVAANAYTFTEACTNASIPAATGFMDNNQIGVDPIDTFTLDDVTGDITTDGSTIVAGAQTVGRTDASLVMAIATANALQSVLMSHYDDGAEHKNGGTASPDTVQFGILSIVPVASSLATLITLVTAEQVTYTAHDLDAKNVAPTYHNAQYAGSDLILGAPATLAACIVALDELTVKYSTAAGSHDKSAVAHTTGNIHGITTALLYKYSSTPTDYIISVSDTSKAVNVDLTTADMVLGRVIMVEDESGLAGTNNITISTQGSEKINGANTKVISKNSGSVSVYTDGIGWFTSVDESALAVSSSVWDRVGTLLIPHTAGDDACLGVSIAVADISGKFSAAEVRSKTMPVYNAKLWGLKGDGGTDDSTAMGVLVAAVISAGGGTLYFPTGNYIIKATQDFGSVPIRIIGDGQELTNLNFTSVTGAGTDCIKFSGDHSRFSDFKITVPASWSYGCFNSGTGSYITWKNIDFAGGTTGIGGTYMIGCVVQNCHFNCYAYDMYLNAAYCLTIRNCVFEGAGQRGGLWLFNGSQEILIEECRFIACGLYAGIYIPASCSKITISNCKFNTCTLDISAAGSANNILIGYVSDGVGYAKIDDLNAFSVMLVGTAKNPTIIRNANLLNSQVVSRTDASLAMALATANDIRTKMIAHLNNAITPGPGSRHLVIDPGVGSIPAAATDLTTLKSLIGIELSVYVLHNLDAINATPTYHSVTATDETLASAVAPIDLAECFTRLRDLKIKFNLHEALSVGHSGVGSVSPVTVDLQFYRTLPTDYYISVYDTSDVVSIELATADMVSGRVLKVKDCSGAAATHNIIISTQGSEKIDGGDTVTISANSGVCRLCADLTKWDTE